MKKSSTHLSSLGMRLVCVYIFVCVCVLLLVLTTTNLGCETTFKMCSNSFSKKKKKKKKEDVFKRFIFQVFYCATTRKIINIKKLRLNPSIHLRSTPTKFTINNNDYSHSNSQQKNSLGKSRLSFSHKTKLGS